MSDRVHTELTPTLMEAFNWLRSTVRGADRMTDSELMARLAETGYRTMRAEAERELKLAAYSEIAADEQRTAEVRAGVVASIEAGLL